VNAVGRTAEKPAEARRKVAGGEYSLTSTRSRRIPEAGRSTNGAGPGACLTACWDRQEIVLWRVIPPWIPRMTAADPQDAAKRSTNRPVLADRSDEVHAAGRIEPALPPQNRAQRPSVGIDHPNQGPGRQVMEEPPDRTKDSPGGAMTRGGAIHDCARPSWPVSPPAGTATARPGPAPSCRFLAARQRCRSRRAATPG
jgi:hypothetical protein